MVKNLPVNAGNVRDAGLIPGSGRFPEGGHGNPLQDSCLENPMDMRAAGSMPGLGKSPGGKHGNPLQDSCLENPMDRGTWWATVHRVAKSRTQLKQLCMHACTHIHTHYAFEVKSVGSGAMLPRCKSQL